MHETRLAETKTKAKVNFFKPATLSCRQSQELFFLTLMRLIWSELLFQISRWMRRPQKRMTRADKKMRHQRSRTEWDWQITKNHFIKIRNNFEFWIISPKARGCERLVISWGGGLSGSFCGKGTRSTRISRIKRSLNFASWVTVCVVA